MLKKIENSVNNSLNKMPGIKKIIKRTYQIGMYSISKKIKSEGKLERVSPSDGMEYFFGYYDKSPWDASDRYMLCLRVKDTTKSVAPNEPADIILIDTLNNNSWQIIGQSRAWNVQQGCMLQWLGPDHRNRIIYNDFRNNKFCSVIYDLSTQTEKIIDMPIYSVSHDGSKAVTLDFSRLHRLRPGYGYANTHDRTIGMLCPDETCIWSIDLNSGEIKSILKYTDLYHFEHREEMKGAEHKVNHLMLNPDGNRFMILHRWKYGNQKYTRLVTANINGFDMYNLLDDGMVSHCNWKNNDEIISYAFTKENGNGYYKLIDQTHSRELILEELRNDGHPSYSPNGKKILTDSYPNRSRICNVYLMKNDNMETIAKVFAPFKYDNEVRCDLHPRWNRSSDKVCIDAAFEGRRRLYQINLKERSE